MPAVISVALGVTSCHREGENIKAFVVVEIASGVETQLIEIFI